MLIELLGIIYREDAIGKERKISNQAKAFFKFGFLITSIFVQLSPKLKTWQGVYISNSSYNSSVLILIELLDS